MYDFSNELHDGLINGLLLGFRLLWEAVSSSPVLIALFAFILIGSFVLKRRSKKRH